MRKFSRTLAPCDAVVCASRVQVSPLYETAKFYIDLGGLPLFKESIACGYYALASERLSVQSWQNRLFGLRLKTQCKQMIMRHLKKEGVSESARICWIFSSDETELHGCRFGCERQDFGRDPAEGNIYEQLPLTNNNFRKISVDVAAKQVVEEKLGWRLDEPYLLCQTRRRKIVVRSSERISAERIIERLAREFRVVLLEFNTGRHLDSYSHFDLPGSCETYLCSSFVEQAALIAHARHCVFFTEGDFGSHIYVPPLLGKNVTAIAPASVYSLGTTPIAFWNREVFRFGGQIYPKAAEAFYAAPDSLNAWLHDVLAHKLPELPSAVI